MQSHPSSYAFSIEIEESGLSGRYFMVIGLCFLLALIVCIVVLVRQISKDEDVKARLESYAKKPLFCVNEFVGVVAICLESEFAQALREHERKLNAGEIKPWEKVQIRVKTTVTLAKSDGNKRPVHSGYYPEDLNLILDKLIQNNTGLEYSPKYHSYFLDARERLVSQESRLFVPYACDSKDFPLSVQYEFYGKASLESLVMHGS